MRRICRRSSLGSSFPFHAQNGAPRYSLVGFFKAFCSDSIMMLSLAVIREVYPPGRGMRA